MLRKLAIAAGVVSAFLLCVSLMGLAVDPYGDYRQRNQLASPSLLYEKLDASYAKEGLSDRFIAEFIQYFRATINYEWPDNVDYMPIQENWILNGMKFFDPFITENFVRDPNTQLFGKVELPSYGDSLSRGFGICSQLSLAGADLLHQRYGIDARVAGLNGHVVMQVFDRHGGSWVVDPSFKKYARGNVNTPEKLPEQFFIGNEKIKNFYYDSSTNFVATRSGWGGYSFRSNQRQELLFQFVIVSFYLKWIIPVLGLLCAFIVCVKSKKPTPAALPVAVLLTAQRP